MTRAIDCEIAKKRLQAWIDESEAQGFEEAARNFRDCISLLDAVPTLTSPNEWVSVEDALPPEHEPVLCIVSGNPNPNITLEDAYQLGSWNKADGWIIDEWLDWEGANVTWWMKLPVPPDRRPPEGEEGDADRG